MRKRTFAERLADNRGSALLSVFVVIMVLLVLGMGVLALSMSNAQQAKVGDTYERSYYAAGGGAQQGVERLKSAALEYYRQVEQEMRSGMQTHNNAADFFAYLDAVTYSPPQPDASAGGPSSLSVSITHTAVSSSTHRYTVLSTATGGTVTRRMRGTVDITFVPIVMRASALPFPNDAVIAGGTFYMDNTTSSVRLNFGVSGNVLFGAYVNPNTDPWYDGFSAGNKNVAGWINPSAADMVDWDLRYASLKPARLTVSPSIAPSTTINTNSFAPLGYAVPSPVYLEGLPTSNLTVSVTISGGGQIYSYRDLSLQNCSYGGTPSRYLTVFCSGNMTFGSTSLNYCKIYCDGNVSMSGGGSISNSEIYCGGNINLGSYGISNTCIVSGNTATLGSGSISGSLVYASNDISITGGTGLNGIFYAGDSVYFNASGSMSGQVAAKGNIYTKSGCSYNVSYSQSTINDILDAPFIDHLGGSGGSSAIIPPTDAQIFTGESAFAEP